MSSVVRLSPTEWERLRDVRLRALEDAPDAFGSTLERESSFAEREWSDLAALGPWWVAVDASSDVGLVAGGRHKVTLMPWVFSMWVDPGHRGSGIAQELVAVVARWAADEGATELGLDVTDRAVGARRLYERLGFRPTGISFPMPRDKSILLVELALDLRDTGLT